MKQFLIKTLWVSILLSFAVPTGTAATAKRPNILIIYADDMGYGDLGIQNADSKIPTPNLDELARSGMRFSDGHSSSGICTPSRYALLTGRHHWRDFHGIVNALGGSVFKPERLTLPEMLKAEGYETAAIGKWHLGWDWDALRKPGTPKKSNQHTDFDWSKAIPDGPLAHGFDYYFGDTVINFPPYAWIENDKLVKAPDTQMDSEKWKPIKEGRWECRPGPMVTGWDPYENIPTTTKKAVEFLIDPKRAEKPYFLYFALPAPHAPIIPNDEFDGKSKAGAYGDFVYEIDHAIGLLLEAVKKSGGEEKTVVIFSADNGPEKYAYARDEKFDHWSSKPFRGLKRDIYEGGHHVPFLVRWPGKTKPESTCDALVSQIDLMATIASALDIKLPKENAAEDSHDLLPLIEGKAEWVRRSHVHNTKKNSYAIRQGDWLLIDDKNGYVSGRNKAWEKQREYPTDDGEPAELYYLKDDIGQKNNIAEGYEYIIAEMQELLKKTRDDGFTAPRLDPADPLLRHVVCMGASVTDGFLHTEKMGGPKTLQYRLGHYLDVGIAAPHGKIITEADNWMAFDAIERGTDVVLMTNERKPSLVVAVDFLFWFCNGKGDAYADDATRLKTFEKGLALLDKINVPIIIGDIPDTSEAVGKMIKAEQLAPAAVRDQANTRLREWASARNAKIKTVVLPMADLMAKSLADQPVTLPGLDLTGKTTNQLLQADKLHPTRIGCAATALMIFEAMKSGLELPADSFLQDSKTIYTEGIELGKKVSAERQRRSIAAGKARERRERSKAEAAK